MNIFILKQFPVSVSEWFHFLCENPYIGIDGHSFAAKFISNWMKLDAIREKERQQSLFWWMLSFFLSSDDFLQRQHTECSVLIEIQIQSDECLVLDVKISAVSSKKFAFFSRNIRANHGYFSEC